MTPLIIDTRHLGRPNIIAVTALELSDGVLLFDTGPESTFDHVVAGLRTLGIDPAHVKHVFLSHIHFDHAGAAWRFAETGATIYVHPRGAPHLIDPEKLVASATRIYGDAMERLWGRFAPIAPDRLRILEDGDIVQVDSLEVRVIETPGHANHHHVYLWGDNLFGGDIAGVRIGGGPPVPPLVPPELQVEWWSDSIEKVRALKVKRMFLPHFGEVEGSIPAHLDALADRIRRWSIWFRDRIRNGDSEEQLVRTFGDYVIEDLRVSGATAEELADYESADPSFMAVAATTRYWRKYHPEAVEGLKG